ncbi:MAG: YIP1 family protein [Desulfonatronovibrio sp.]
MQIICPKCEFMQDVPDEKIPPKAEKATCPKCGEKFKFRSVSKQDFQLEEEPGDHSNENTKNEPDSGYAQNDDQDDSIWSSLENIGAEERVEDEQPPPPPESGFEVPWENLNQVGFFPGFIETIKRAMLAPTAFFYRMPLKGLAMPLAFFLLISVIQALATFIWNMAGIFPTTAQHGSGELGMGMMGLGSAFIIVIYPLFMGLWLFIASGVTHIFLTLFKAGNSGFEGTFRATAYGTAPMILSLLPFAGPVAGAAWSLVITIIGYKNIHETSFIRIVMAMLAPVVVLIMAAALLY